MKKTLFLVFILSLIITAFVAGRATTQPEIRHDSPPLCLYRDTALRASPTGYIVFRLSKGTQLWVNRVESPFAYVSYFDGSQWFDGTVTASYLGPCGGENKERTHGH